jgi:hypothetical protein
MFWCCFCLKVCFALCCNYQVGGPRFCGLCAWGHGSYVLVFVFALRFVLHCVVTSECLAPGLVAVPWDRRRKRILYGLEISSRLHVLWALRRSY